MLPRAPLLAVGAFALVACTDSVSPPSTPPNVRPNVPKQAGPAVVDNSTVPVQFTLSSALCHLPTDVTGTGVLHSVTRASQSTTGEWNVVLNLTAHGTASGTDGSTYVFDYAGVQAWVDPVSPTTFPLVVDIVDHFNLLGQGRTPDVMVYLRGKFTFPAFEPVDNPVIRGLDIFCDPI